jgi:hypothetical protein
VIVKTRPVKVIIEAATVDRICRALVGPPEKISQPGSTATRWSTVTVRTASSTAPATKIPGTNQRPVRSVSRR